METTKSVVEGLTAEHEEAMDFSLALCEDEIAREVWDALATTAESKLRPFIEKFRCQSNAVSG